MKFSFLFLIFLLQSLLNFSDGDAGHRYIQELFLQSIMLLFCTLLNSHKIGCGKVFAVIRIGFLPCFPHNFVQMDWFCRFLFVVFGQDPWDKNLNRFSLF